MGKQLELPATLFFWWLAIEISFLPTMINRQLDDIRVTQPWMKTMNKVLVSIFVGTILNFVEKIIIQLIAMRFHLRTYQDRIEINKFQLGSLTKLYEYSKKELRMEDREFEDNSGGPPSGTRTPGQWMNEATKHTRVAANKVGDVAGKIAGDFTGKKVIKSTHPQQVVLALLNSTSGSQVLARRLYRTFYREETQTIHEAELADAFSNEEETAAAFSMFDKDMNGDISMEELEAVCVEIGRERKSIMASLKDLDSVVSKLDNVFSFIVLVITVLVFVSLISTSAAGALTSAGSTILALSWLFSATAQEFLQSIIFVFVKHPFDVGDRVKVFGNQGLIGQGDDYFVKEISLLYTEFKKMEGHIVQAPNSYLNTLFILNQRRSGGLAEAVPIIIKFGTTLEQMEALRARLLEFVTAEKREYQASILTELKSVNEAHSLTLNVIFFYKSNWQNEGLRLSRRNKFICALMVTMQDLKIEGPRMRYPGMKESFPVYLQGIPHIGTPGMGHGGHPDDPKGFQPQNLEHNDLQSVPEDVGRPGSLHAGNTSTPTTNSEQFTRATSFRAPNRRDRRESLSAMGRRVDFSLGARDTVSGNMMADIYDDGPASSSDLVSRTTGRMGPDVRDSSSSRQRESLERMNSVETAIRATGRSFSSTTSRSNSHTYHASPQLNGGILGGGLLRRSTADTQRSTSITPSISSNSPQNQTGSSHTNTTTHKNRFFGRFRSNTSTSSTVRDELLMESGLADVPEGNGSASESRGVSPAHSGTFTAEGGFIKGDQLSHGVPEGGDKPVLGINTSSTAENSGSGVSLRKGSTTSVIGVGSPLKHEQKLDPRTGLVSDAAWHSEGIEGTEGIDRGRVIDNDATIQSGGNGGVPK